MMNLNCIHFNQGCSGCTLSSALDNPPIFQEAILFFRATFAYTLPTFCGNIHGWRERAKLAVRGRSNHPQVGLFKEGTHEALDIPCCRVHHPKINQAAEVIREWIIEEQISLYDEKTGLGALRYLQLTYDKVSDSAQVVLILNQSLTKTVFQSLWDKGKGFHSLWVNFNQGSGNTIWGNFWEKIFGLEWLTLPLLGKNFYYHPASFMQANPQAFEALLQDLNTHLMPSKKCVEYYAGSGVIGLSVLSKTQSMTFLEANKLGNICYQENLKSFSEDDSIKTKYVELEAAKGAYLLDEVDTIIVDPPRKGIDAALLKEIGQSSVKQLVYISCGWESFKRDAQFLKLNGFKLKYAKGYLFFPGTNHIETLSIFSRL